MAELNFAQVGYKKDGNFVPTPLRARDVTAANGTTVEQHITDAGIHLTPEQATLIAGAIQSALLGAANGVATLDAGGHVPATQLDLGAYATSANVAAYEDMLALSTTQAPINSFVFVADATGDTTVTEGWASYKRVADAGAAADYVKVAEGESLDIVIPDLQEEVDAAAAAAAAAQTAADGAQGTADTAVTNAATAQSTADGAATEAAKLDFAYCESEADMATKNLREGALVLMAVSNGPADE